MRRLLLSAALAIPALGLPLLTGCEHETQHDHTTVRHEDGTMERKDTTVTEKSNGDVVTETHKRNP